MSLRLKFLAVLGTAFLGLIVAGTAYAALLSSRDAQAWVTHTYEVISAVRQQEAAMSEAESAQRGLLIAESPGDRDRYEQACARALGGIDRLTASTVDNPSQQRRLVRLREATLGRIRILDDVLREKGSTPRLAEGRAAMDVTRSLSAEAEAEERSLLADRIDRANRQTTVTKVVLVVGSLAAFFLSVLFMRDLQRDVAAREETRHLIERQAEQLAEQAVSLEASKNEAETANRTKSMFLANMSHELRTPLNAVLGYSEMLQEEAEDRGLDDLIPDLKSIHAAGKHLLGLINDVLDLSKIEAGKMELFLEDFDVGGMLSDVERTIRPLITEKSNELVLKTEGAGVMHADLTKVRQTLFNVLSNAAKFTTQGTIRLDVTVEDKGEKPFVVFRVSDTGVGMSEEQLGRLFEPFVQADSSTTRKFGGTGLGLAISRRFCRMMGGEISATSELGRGSVFTISLPANVQQSEPVVSRRSRLAPDASEPRQVVLVIDDDPDTRDLMDRHLSKEGYRVLCASSGNEGLALAREQHPIAITLDVMMPTTDGWAVLTALKADPDLREIPVIMLTMVSDRGLGYRLGASEFMTKPIDRDRLAQVISRYRHSVTSGIALVVEDDPQTRRMTRTMLERDGWQVNEAENGVAALEQVAVALPDVIVLDLMMPTMDGFEFAATLHAREAWKNIPIVVLTAKDITDEDRTRLNGSVEKIIQKGSYDRRQLLDEVRDIVNHHARLHNERDEKRATA